MELLQIVWLRVYIASPREKAFELRLPRLGELLVGRKVVSNHLQE